MAEPVPAEPIDGCLDGDPRPGEDDCGDWLPEAEPEELLGDADIELGEPELLDWEALRDWDCDCDWEADCDWDWDWEAD